MDRALLYLDKRAEVAVAQTREPILSFALAE
jgi:hypothetical protein